MNLDSQVQQAMGELDNILSILTYSSSQKDYTIPPNKDCNKNIGEVYFTWSPYVC